MPARPVLVLDDTVEFVRTITAIAAAYGLPTVATDNPDSVAGLLAAHAPAAAIVDCLVGDRYGLAVLGVIGATMPHLPTLVVSGYGEAFLAQAEQEGRSHGLAQVRTLAKPFSADALRAFLAEAVAAA